MVIDFNIPQQGHNNPTTIGGKYAVGDTRTNPTGCIKITSDNIEEWQEGFDRIDIAPKDGKLSLEEVCDYRDRQCCWASFMSWFHILDVQKFYNIRENISKEQRTTEEYRKSITSR